MRLRRTLITAALFGLGSASAPLGAGADIVFAGACQVEMTLVFSSAISQTSGPTTVSSFDGGGPCQTNADDSNVPWSLAKTITIDADDLTSSGNVTKCHDIEIDEGTYEVSFTPGTAVPTTSNGTWSFKGNVGGGVLLLTGDNPTFVGVGTLVIDPLDSSNSVDTANLYKAQACALGGSFSSVRYAGTFVFGDP